ncbi:MAG: hypothetical protein ACEPOV_01530 [Hyphomicrobiales bacterium]
MKLFIPKINGINEMIMYFGFMKSQNIAKIKFIMKIIGYAIPNMLKKFKLEKGWIFGVK